MRRSKIIRDSGPYKVTSLANGKSQLVGWCPEHETWQPLEDKVCGFIYHDHTNGRLRRRRLYICSHADCQEAFVKAYDFRVHEC